MVATAVLFIVRPGDFRNRASAALIAAGCLVAHAGDAHAVGVAFPQSGADAVIIADCPEMPWRLSAVLSRRIHPRASLILVATESSEQLAIAALRAGFDDYVTDPCDPEDVVAAVRRTVGHARTRARRGSSRAPTQDAVPALVGQSRAIREITGYVHKLATTDTNVLITGETGTGKELVAELIHHESHRRSRPFVSVNCAAIPDTLLESELFGYERGAFTGAHAATAGKLEGANGGTVFLDEVGDMSPAGQAKILRVTGGKELFRLGGKDRIRVDVRVLAATNQDLEALMVDGRFRRDLYFRLNVARVQLPPLRERLEDVPSLVEHYVREYNRRFNREIEGFSDEATEMLLRYGWPGNVRELKNVIEAVFVTQASGRITAYDLPAYLREHLAHAATLPSEERQRLLAALTATHWNKSRAAEQLHWSRMTLYRKMAKYGVAHDDE